MVVYLHSQEICDDPPSGTGHTKKKGPLALECDEVWSFVGSKDNKQWVWLALDRDTREIVGVAIGHRDDATAQHLWDSLPAVYRQCAVCYTDFWSSYRAILPKKRHKPSAKGDGETNHVERVNNTLRQRIGRLVRKTLAFSKSLEHHIGEIWSFIHHYNALRAAAMAAPLHI